MKKTLSLVVLMAALAVGAGAQGLSLSAGAGFLFAGSFGDGMKGKYHGLDIETSLNNLGFGGVVYFDATYVELDVGFVAGPSTMKAKRGEDDDENKGSFMAMDFSLLGKFPIGLTDKLSLFPLLGVDYTLMLSVKDKDGDKVADDDGDKTLELSVLGFRAGVGVDFSLSDALYLRGEALFGLGLPSKFMSDNADKIDDVDATLSIGPTVKLAVGYRFVTF